MTEQYDQFCMDMDGGLDITDPSPPPTRALTPEIVQLDPDWTIADEDVQRLQGTLIRGDVWANCPSGTSIGESMEVDFTTKTIRFY